MTDYDITTSRYKVISFDPHTLKVTETLVNDGIYLPSILKLIKQLLGKLFSKDKDASVNQNIDELSPSYKVISFDPHTLKVTETFVNNVESASSIALDTEILNNNLQTPLSGASPISSEDSV